jgi:hypothetical protein
MVVDLAEDHLGSQSLVPHLSEVERAVQQDDSLARYDQTRSVGVVSEHVAGKCWGLRNSWSAMGTPLFAPEELELALDSAEAALVAAMLVFGSVPASVLSAHTSLLAPAAAGYGSRQYCASNQQLDLAEAAGFAAEALPAEWQLPTAGPAVRPDSDSFVG